jgi:hypothetical protein
VPAGWAADALLSGDSSQLPARYYGDHWHLLRPFTVYFDHQATLALANNKKHSKVNTEDYQT